MVDYSKWDKLDFSSDEDDCHPNIEINTWRRMKERMRAEKGLKKREPDIKDKWNTTSVNRAGKKNVIISRTGASDSAPSKTSQSQPSSSQPMASAASTSTDASSTTTTAVPSTSTQQSSSPEEKDPSADMAVTAVAAAAPVAVEEEEEEEEVFHARSDPNVFLKSHMKELRKFAKIKSDDKADNFIKKHPHIIHEAAEGFLITFAVDTAVEGASTAVIERMSKRCLMVHNLVQSCSTGNVKPEIGVELFYKKMAHPKMMAEYRRELGKQLQELVTRIEARRIERIREAEEEMIAESEKAPDGPGGLDPTEVLNSLPKEMQDAFISQDVQTLQNCLESMSPELASFHMQRCIDSGLWVANAEEAEAEGRPPVEVDIDAVEENRRQLEQQQLSSAAVDEEDHDEPMIEDID